MRAKEFIINIPVTIKFDDDEDMGVELPNMATGPEEYKNEPEISPVKIDKPEDQEKLATNFVPPLQQKIELMKNAAGKSGPIIDQIVADDDNEAA